MPAAAAKARLPKTISGVSTSAGKILVSGFAFGFVFQVPPFVRTIPVADFPLIGPVASAKNTIEIPIGK